MRSGGSRIITVAVGVLAASLVVGLPVAQGQGGGGGDSRAAVGAPTTDAEVAPPEVRRLHRTLASPWTSGPRVIDVHFFRNSSPWGESPLTEAFARDLITEADEWAAETSAGLIRLRFASVTDAPAIAANPCPTIEPVWEAVKGFLPVQILPGATDATWISVSAIPPGDCGGVNGRGYVGFPGMWMRLTDPSRVVGVDLSTLAHELGHNLGLQHSNGFGINPSWTSTPSILEYADQADVMGWGVWHQTAFGWNLFVNDLHAHNRNLLGVLPQSSIVYAVGDSEEFIVAPVGSQAGTTAVYLPWLDRSKFVIDYRPTSYGNGILDSGQGSGSGVYVRLVDSGANEGPEPYTALSGTGAFTWRIGLAPELLVHGYRVGQRVALPDGSAVEVLSLGSDSARIRVTRPPDLTPPSIGPGVIEIRGCVDDPCTLPANTAKWGPSGAEYVFTTSTMPSPSDDVWLASARFTVSETVIAEVARIPNGRDEETERVLETPIGVQVAPGTWDVRLEAVDLAGNEAAATATVIAPPAALPAGRWQSFGRNVRYTFPGWNRLADCAEGTTCIGLTVEAAVKPCKRGISVVVLAKGAGKKTLATMRKTSPSLAKGARAFLWFEAPVSARVSGFTYQAMTCR